MDTHKRLHENISALSDGELPDSERELAFAALGTAEGQAAWRAYHLTGDVLRGEAAGAALSAGFGAALAARLAAEPAYMPAMVAVTATAPTASPAQTAQPAEAAPDAASVPPDTGVAILP